MLAYRERVAGWTRRSPTRYSPRRRQNTEKNLLGSGPPNDANRLSTRHGYEPFNVPLLQLRGRTSARAGRYAIPFIEPLRVSCRPGWE